MKVYYTSILLLSFSITLQGQTKQEIEKKMSEIDITIDSLESVKRDYKKQLDSISYAKLLGSKSDKDVILIAVSKNGIIKDYPNIKGKEIAKVRRRQRVKYLGQMENDHAFVTNDTIIGWMSDDIINMISSTEYSNESINMEIEKSREKRTATIIELTKLYGLEAAEKIVDGKYWIGMTDKMCKQSLGKPNDINRDVGAWGVHEQWIYERKGLYIYFENGYCTSYQDR